MIVEKKGRGGPLATETGKELESERVCVWSGGGRMSELEILEGVVG